MVKRFKDHAAGDLHQARIAGNYRDYGTALENHIKDIPRLSDGRLNGRAAAMKGIHTMSKELTAKYGHPKVGSDGDFYSKENGDKRYGIITAYNGKHITFQDRTDGIKGRKHKFMVHWEK